MLYFAKEFDRAGNDFVRVFGVTFREFVTLVTRPLNLLFLRHELKEVQEFHEIKFQGLYDRWLDELIESDIELRGDFNWVDFADDQRMIAMCNQELAELCYLRIIGEPLKSPMFPSLQNRYVYFSHDDGWMATIYFRDFECFTQLLLGSIAKRCYHHTGRAFLGDQLSAKILDIWYRVKEGVVIEIDRSGNTTLQICEVGQFLSVDGLIRSRQAPVRVHRITVDA